MVQSETATQRGSTVGALPAIFAPNGRIAEAPPSAAAATPGGAEAPAVVPTSETLSWKDLTYKGRTFEFSREVHIRVLE
jgi:hypothetical protein